MLKSIVDKDCHMKCNQCSLEYVENVNGVVKVYTEEGEYENLNVSCPNCGQLEVFNLNIPVNDTDEPFETGELPVDEEIQRHYVRLLIRMVRDDFVGG
ncbi:hypothetical protein [Halobacillus salinus]|uniref:hypothetical protein n=1 Tax=Halobacillus salinus TaxID=192814 RepID=UPI0009A7D556|nr:hypothetical protein [Halobacillus salinus]